MVDIWYIWFTVGPFLSDVGSLSQASSETCICCLQIFVPISLIRRKLTALPVFGLILSSIELCSCFQ